jgi:hypothetical protein
MKRTLTVIKADNALHQRLVRGIEGLESSIELMPGGMLQLERVGNNPGRLRATMGTVDDLFAEATVDRMLAEAI